MSFSNDEELLNSINLDSIKDYAKYIQELRPILLDNSGYESVYNPDYQVGLDAARAKVSARSQQIDDEMSAQTRSDGTPRYTRQQITDAVNSDAQIKQYSKDLDAYQATNSSSKLQKTSARTALEDRFNKIQDSELKRIEEEMAYWDSDQGKKVQQQQRDLVQSQGELSQKQLDRQKWALSDDWQHSDVLNKQIQDEFNKFKESQARAGNVIMGDDPTTAVAKGTAAQQSLGVFQDNMKAAIQRERDAIIQGEGPVTQSGLNLSAGLTAGALDFGGPGPWTQRTPAFNNAAPGSPNYGALNSMSLASEQPYQFSRSLDFNYADLAAKRKTGSGKSGFIGSSIGAGIGGLLAAPTGGMSIPVGMMLGSQFGNAAGLMF